MTIHDSERWDEIHQKSGEVDSHSHYAEEKEKLFPRNCLVIDVGGGTGDDALYFLKKGHTVVLLDISKFALNKASEKVKAAKLDKNFAIKEADYGLHALPVKDNSADVVYSRISLNYFDAEHTARLFMDILRVLKPGGVAYLTFKSPEDADEMEYLSKMTTLFEPNVFIENGMLRSRFTVDQLEHILKMADIKNCKVQPFHEQIGSKKEGHLQTLFLNEVTFNKD